MNEGNRRPALIYEERKAMKLFLLLFYIIYIAYDVIGSILIPKFTSFGAKAFSDNGLGYWLHAFIFCLLPISIYLLKKGNPYSVKYFFVFGFIFIDIIDNFIKYFGNTKTFASGDIVEVLFVFFSPLFVNKKYFWTVSLGVIGKYLLLGFVLQRKDVLVPIILIMIISAIAFILLIRFYSYIHSLTAVHEELRQKEKLAVVGQMAAAISHEIRNPLSALRGFTQLQNEKYPHTNDFYPIMIEEIDRINSIVNDLMYIGKPMPINLERSSIEEIIAYTVSITKQQATCQGVTIETNLEGPIAPIDCDEKRLKQVFINLLKNAIEAMPQGGRVIIDVHESDESNLAISIVDEGCGISRENLDNLGEPFYSTKRDGTGLGLVVTNQIIADHGGTLNIHSKVGEGTKIEISLPKYQK